MFRDDVSLVPCTLALYVCGLHLAVHEAPCCFGDHSIAAAQGCSRLHHSRRSVTCVVPGKSHSHNIVTFRCWGGTDVCWGPRTWLYSVSSWHRRGSCDLHMWCTSEWDKGRKQMFELCIHCSAENVPPKNNREVEYERPSLSPFSFSEKSFAFVSKYYVDHSGTNNSKVYA